MKIDDIARIVNSVFGFGSLPQQANFVNRALFALLANLFFENKNITDIVSKILIYPQSCAARHNTWNFIDYVSASMYFS